jgi:hypothetical protein
VVPRAGTVGLLAFPVLRDPASRPNFMRRSLVMVGLVLASLLPVPPSVTHAKEFEIDGTIDCGRPSGTLCLPLGASVGVITDQITGKKARFEVAIGLILEQKLKKTKVGRLLLQDTEGVYRTMLFAQLKPLMDQLAKFDPTELSAAEKERLVDQLFDESLPRQVASARDKLVIVSQNFKQDARVRVVVNDQLAPILVATEVVEYHDFQLSQRRSSGTQNHGAMTGSDSEEFVCTDFVEEGLDFVKERIQEEGRFELTNNEELFFDLLADLPIPCTDKEERITKLIVNWIRWNLKATIDELATNEELQERKGERRRDRLERLRAFLDTPGARFKLLQILRETILKPRPDGRRPFKGLLEERKR